MWFFTGLTVQMHVSWMRWRFLWWVSWLFLRCSTSQLRSPRAWCTSLPFISSTETWPPGTVWSEKIWWWRSGTLGCRETFTALDYYRVKQHFNFRIVPYVPLKLRKNYTVNNKSGRSFGLSSYWDLWLIWSQLGPPWKWNVTSQGAILSINSNLDTSDNFRNWRLLHFLLRSGRNIWDI